jgi:hypothetical protein
VAALRPAGWQPGQLAALVGFAAGMDFEQLEHPDHQIGVNLHRPASLIPVGGGHPAHSTSTKRSSSADAHDDGFAPLRTVIRGYAVGPNAGPRAGLLLPGSR